MAPWAFPGHVLVALGRSWGALGHSWGALGALLGRFWGSWKPLGRLLDASWTRLAKKPRGITLLEPNLGPKIHPSWLQNPLKIDVKKQIDFETIFSRFFDVLHRFQFQSKNVNFVKNSILPR